MEWIFTKRQDADRWVPPIRMAGLWGRLTIHLCFFSHRDLLLSSRINVVSPARPHTFRKRWPGHKQHCLIHILGPYMNLGLQCRRALHSAINFKQMRWRLPFFTCRVTPNFRGLLLLRGIHIACSRRIANYVDQIKVGEIILKKNTC